MRIHFVGSNGTYLTAITRAYTFSGQLRALGIVPGDWYRNSAGEIWDRATGELIGLISK